MELYRITLAKYAQELHASTYPGRWNPRDLPVIYASTSRSLACLENMVHRGQKMFDQRFSVMVIQAPDYISPHKVHQRELSEEWYQSTKESYKECQSIGHDWHKAKRSALLLVPSAVIREEYNWVINPKHEDMRQIKLIRTEDITIDERLNMS